MAADLLDEVPQPIEAVANGAEEASPRSSGGTVVAEPSVEDLPPLQLVDGIGDPGRARTFNPEIKSLLLYH
jgi:hypothetical protein